MVAVRLVAFLAVLRVVVVARLADDAVVRADFFAEVTVPLAPDTAALVVLAAPDFTLRAVCWTPSTAVPAARRVFLALVRAAVVPVGDTLGLSLRRMRAMRSCTAVTLPWAMPLMLSPTRSTTPAIAPTTALTGGASGDARVRMGRRRLLRVRQGLAEIGERGPTQLTAHLREEVAFLLLDVVADVLHEHRDLGVEALVRGIEVDELGQHPLDDVVLFEALECDVLGAGHRRPSDRIEHQLLDRGVDRQLLDDPIDDLSLLDMGAIARFLEALEQLLDGLVVVTEKGECIHAALVPETLEG